MGNDYAAGVMGQTDLGYGMMGVSEGRSEGRGEKNEYMLFQELHSKD